MKVQKRHRFLIPFLSLICLLSLVSCSDMPSSFEMISGSPLITGNKVTLMIDGPATYEAMVKAIRSTRDHINFETFIFDYDEVGRRFADLLLQKQTEGIQVNLIYGSVRCMTTPSTFFQRLRDS